MSSYLLAGQASEIERLQLQSLVWEPAGKALVSAIPAPARAKALDVGCGALGWLRVLSDWVGADGQVTGVDVDERMLTHAREFVGQNRLANVSVVADDFFSTRLPRGTFDLVHARFQIAPLGRAGEQVALCKALARPGGWIVLEDPDVSSWRVHPRGDATAKLIDLLAQGFAAAGGDLSAGPRLPTYLREAGLTPQIVATVVPLQPAHPYLRLPLQFAESLRPRLLALVGAEELDGIISAARAEIKQPETWGTTFTLIQAYAQIE